MVGGGPNASVIHYSRNDQKVSYLPNTMSTFSGHNLD